MVAYMRLGFLLSGLRTTQKGEARALLNWARGLNKDRATVFLHRCNVDPGHVRDLPTYSVTNERDLINLIGDLDFLVSDDYRAPLASMVCSKAGIRYAVYVQVLAGLHVLGGLPTGADGGAPLASRLGGLLPFRLITKRYVEALRNAACVISNSSSAAVLLWNVYGMQPDAIVYPAVNTEIFRPPDTPPERERVALFLGSGPFDTNPKFVRRLVASILEETPSEVLLLGDVSGFGSSLGPLVKAGRITAPGWISEDALLATQYGQSSLTLAPQHFESFGHVVLESLSCGTPAVSLLPHDALTTHKTGTVAWSDSRFVDAVLEWLNGDALGAIRKRCREVAVGNFSIAVSTARLLRTLEEANSGRLRGRAAYREILD